LEKKNVIFLNDSKKLLTSFCSGGKL